MPPLRTSVFSPTRIYLIVGAGALILGAALMASTIIIPMVSCSRLACIVFGGPEKRTVTEVYEDTGSVYRAMLTADNYRVRAEKRSGITPQDALLLTKVNVMQVNGLFDDARSPYPGAISDRIQCDPSLKPMVTEIRNGDLAITTYEAWLNSRLQYGTCVSSDVAYRSYNALFYCQHGNAYYHLEFIAPQGITDDMYFQGMLRSIRCR